MKILGAIWELPAKQHCQSNPNRQCCLAGSSKTASRILIFLIAMGAEYLSYVKSIATFALTFFWYIISVLASVFCQSEYRAQPKSDTLACSGTANLNQVAQGLDCCSRR